MNIHEFLIVAAVFSTVGVACAFILPSFCRMILKLILLLKNRPKFLHKTRF